MNLAWRGSWIVSGRAKRLLVPGSVFASAEVHANSSPGRRAGEGAGRDIGAAAGLDDQHTSFLEEAIISIFTPQVRV